MKFDVLFHVGQPLIEAIEAENFQAAMEAAAKIDGASGVRRSDWKTVPKHVDVIPAEIYFQAMPQMLAAYAGKYILSDKAGDILAVVESLEKAEKKAAFLRKR